jgi:8-oxo-dGTP pyrophosphatase MutT (NUDIX family)
LKKIFPVGFFINKSLLTIMSKHETRSEIVIRAGIILSKVLPDGTSVYLILLGRDTYDSRGKWGFPKGHIEPKDKNDPINTALRELWEETRIEIAYEAINPENTFKCDRETIIFYNVDLKESQMHIKMPDELRVVDPEEIVRIKWAKLEDIIQIPEKDKNSPMRQWLEKKAPVRKWQESAKPKSRQWKMINESWR